ncbi:MAG: hypothetical protein LUH02_04395 [Erysipelotrichaceae bacterium]|nr:hypothetical protein [Erysipelotrichaceae bacterium]
MFKEGYKYFEHSLTGKELLFYQKTYQAIKNRDVSIAFDYHDVASERAREIVKYVFEDNPSFFYFSPYKIIYAAGFPSFIFFNYFYDDKQIEKYENDIKYIIMRFFDEYNVLELPVYNRILIFHNFISSLCTYDQVVADGGIGVNEDYNIIGVFQGKEAVCYGFSQVFKLLCDYANIDCLIIRGDVGGAHAWNMVEYHGKFYHIDVTWDLSKGKNKGLLGAYTYFMVDDEWILKSRTINQEAHYPISHGIENTLFGKKGYVVKDTYNLENYFYNRLLEYPKEIVVYVEDHQMNSTIVHQAYDKASQRFCLKVNRKMRYSSISTYQQYSIACIKVGDIL